MLFQHSLVAKPSDSYYLEILVVTETLTQAVNMYVDCSFIGFGFHIPQLVHKLTACEYFVLIAEQFEQQHKFLVGKLVGDTAAGNCKRIIVKHGIACVELMLVGNVTAAQECGYAKEHMIDTVIVAIIAFGLNSAAYVAEVFRSGVMSIDEGQFEAGRSLGFSYGQTMWHIVMPQAFKNVLPALANEFITLLKETSVSGYIGLIDLTKAGDIIRSRTFAAFFPLLAVALIYLIMVVVLSAGVTRLERRLRNGAR